MADNYLEKKFEEHYSAAQPQKQTKRQPLKVRRIYVTGGANGIGAAIVRSLRVAGNRVAFCDIDREKGEALAACTGTTFEHVDVRDAQALEASLRKIAEAWGDIDAVINNVGVSHFGPITETTVEDFDDTYRTNLRPVFVTSSFVARWRKEHGNQSNYGRIVNLCSTRWQMSEIGTEAYSASKGGIFSLTHALAMSMQEYHVTVNSISPGWIATHDYDKLTQADHEQHPSGRVGKPDDVARIVRFLLAEENDFVCGENITVDGGMTRKMIYVE